MRGILICMGSGKGKLRRTQSNESNAPSREVSQMVVLDDGVREWRLPNGDLHRVDGPAVESPNGMKT